MACLRHSCNKHLIAGLLRALESYINTTTDGVISEARSSLIAHLDQKDFQRARESLDQMCNFNNDVVTAMQMKGYVTELQVKLDLTAPGALLVKMEWCLSRRELHLLSTVLETQLDMSTDLLADTALPHQPNGVDIPAMNNRARRECVQELHEEVNLTVEIAILYGRVQELLSRC